MRRTIAAIAVLIASLGIVGAQNPTPAPPAAHITPTATPQAVAPAASPGYHHVDGYTKKDGTYVPEHYQTNPNGTKADNWSTKGNVNPLTGKPGWIATPVPAK